MKYYLKALENYATFSGRTSRKEYWMFVLFNVLFAFAAIIIDNNLGTIIQTDFGFSSPYGYVYVLYVSAVLIPGIAISVRRLHDVGKSGWYLLILLIPLIGSIWFVILLLTDSKRGENKYGPNPNDTYF